LNDLIASSNTRLKELQADLIAKDSDFEQLVQSLTDSVVSLTNDKEDMKKEIDELLNSNIEINNKALALEEESKQLQSLHEKDNAMLQSLLSEREANWSSDLNSLQSIVDDGIVERQQLQTLLDESVVERQRLESLVDDGDDERQRLVNDGDDERQRLQSLVNDGDDERQRLQSLVDEGASERQRLQSLVDEDWSERQGLQSLVDESENQGQRLQSHFDEEAESERQRLVQVIDEGENERQRLQQIVNDKQLEVNEGEASRERLQQMILNFFVLLSVLPLIVLENIRLDEELKEKISVISSLNTSLQTSASDNDSIKHQLESITSELNTKNDRVTELENLLQSQSQSPTPAQSQSQEVPISTTNLEQILNEIITLKNKVNDDNEHIKNNHDNIIKTISTNHTTTTELINAKHGGCNCIVS